MAKFCYFANRTGSIYNGFCIEIQPEGNSTKTIFEYLKLPYSTSQKLFANHKNTTFSQTITKRKNVLFSTIKIITKKAINHIFLSRKLNSFGTETGWSRRSYQEIRNNVAGRVSFWDFLWGILAAIFRFPSTIHPTNYFLSTRAFFIANLTFHVTYLLNNNTQQ